MKIVQAKLSDVEYKMLEEYARKSGKSIKEVVHEAILKFITKISPEDSIFTQPPAASKTGKHEKTSEQHDKILYGVN